MTGRSDAGSAGRFVAAAWAAAWRSTRWNIACWVVFVVAAAVEVVLVIVLRSEEVHGWELSLTRELQGVFGWHGLFHVTNFVTNTLALPFLVFFAGLTAVFASLGRFRVAALVLLTFPIHVVSQFPKALIERPRPSSLYEGIEGVGGVQSFPSGHAEFVITFYGLLVYLAVHRLGSTWSRVVVTAGWVLLVALVGVGRVAMGRHWPIDVLASYVIGLGALAALIWLDRALREAELKVFTEHAPGGAPGSARI